MMQGFCAGFALCGLLFCGLRMIAILLDGAE